LQLSFVLPNGEVSVQRPERDGCRCAGGEAARCRRRQHAKIQDLAPTRHPEQRDEEDHYDC